MDDEELDEELQEIFDIVDAEEFDLDTIDLDDEDFENANADDLNFILNVLEDNKIQEQIDEDEDEENELEDLLTGDPFEEEKEDLNTNEEEN